MRRLIIIGVLLLAVSAGVIYIGTTYFKVPPIAYLFAAMAGGLKGVYNRLYK